jgi:parallel beta-helix repeat protein
MPRGSRLMGNSFNRDEEAVNQIFSPNCCVISGNTFTNSRWFSIVIQDGDGATQGNRIFGGGTGIAAVADAVDTTVVSTGDRVFATSAAPFREIECCGYNATLIVR